MKKIFVLICMFCSNINILFSQSPSFKISFDGAPEQQIVDKASLPLKIKPDRIAIKVEGGISGKKYTLLNATDSLLQINNTSQDINLNGIKYDKIFQIFEDNKLLLGFRINLEKDSDLVRKVSSSSQSMPSIKEVLSSKFSGLKVSPLGVFLNGKSETNYSGEGYIHLFFDELGNSLITTIPQGVAYKQYIVHILYRQFDDNTISYSVSQTKGGFNSRLFLDNAGELTRKAEGSGGNPAAKNYSSWVHTEIAVTSSNDDAIEFQIFRGDYSNGNKTSVGSYSIKIDKVYHGSFDIGLLNTKLANPTYELVDSPTGNNEKVIKESNNGNYGVVTAMMTFYTSPIRILRNILSSKKYKLPQQTLLGRSYYDDHEWFERLYPAVGVSISQNAFKNLFFGLNWEFARGGHIFLGGHYGEVNSYTSKSSNFEFGKSIVKESEFNLNKGTEWKIGWTYGLKLDISIIREFFGNIPNK